MAVCRGLSLTSGGLDSQLAIKVLQRAGAEVEAVCFSSPFFDMSGTERAVKTLGVALRVVDFTDDIVSLIKSPAHGFGGAMNPCIDCHALMIRRAGELMERLGYDFVATGEVQGQRPIDGCSGCLCVAEGHHVTARLAEQRVGVGEVAKGMDVDLGIHNGRT